MAGKCIKVQFNLPEDPLKKLTLHTLSIRNPFTNHCFRLSFIYSKRIQISFLHVNVQPYIFLNIYRRLPVPRDFIFYTVSRENIAIIFTQTPKTLWFSSAIATLTKPSLSQLAFINSRFPSSENDLVQTRPGLGPACREA